MKFHFSIVWMATAFIVQGQAQDDSSIGIPPSDGEGSDGPFDGVLNALQELIDFSPIVKGLKELAANDDFFTKIKGSDLSSVVNCNGIPVGLTTNYTVARYVSWASFMGKYAPTTGDLPKDNPVTGITQTCGLLPGGDFSYSELRDPDGSESSDDCRPYTKDASDKRAYADSTSSEEARACVLFDSECCGESMCVEKECKLVCLVEDDACLSDERCACIGPEYGCEAQAIGPVPANSNLVPQDPNQFSGTCAKKTDRKLQDGVTTTGGLPSGFTPICLVFNDDMFAIRFLPAFLPIINLPGLKKPCSLYAGLEVMQLPTIAGVITAQIIGMGIVFGNTYQGDDVLKSNLRYGSSGTTGPDTVNPPKVYDGLTNIAFSEVDGMHFWFSFQLNILSKIKLAYDKAKCSSGFPRPDPGRLSKFKITMLFELYIKADDEQPCVLAVIPKIEAKFGLFPVMNLGSGMGGYCRVKGDRCVPDGAFVNILLTPKIPGISGILEDILSLGDGDSNSLGAAGAAFGYFLDKETGEPTGALLKAYMESPKFLGLSLGGGFDCEFQYITNEELERRRWTITKDGKDGEARCPAYKDCESWKPYKLVDFNDIEQRDGNDAIRYKDQYICATKLEDQSSATGVGPFNRQLFARVPKISDQKNEKVPSPDEWHVQDFFQGYDMFVVSLQVSDLKFGFFSLDKLSFSMVVFGDIQPAVDPDEVFDDPAFKLNSCEQAALNDELYVYMEVEAAITILFIVKFEGRLLIANVPVTAGSGIPSTNTNPNKWILEASAEISVLGMRARVDTSGEWYYVSDTRRRRLQDGTDVCADVQGRKLKSNEHLQRALQDSKSLDAAPLAYGVTMLCDGLECLADMAEFVIAGLTAAWEEIEKAYTVVAEFAEKAFEALVEVVDQYLQYLEVLWDDFVGDVAEIWNAGVEKFNALFEDEFDFADLAAFGEILLEGGVAILTSAVTAIGGALNIGSKTNDRGERELTASDAVNQFNQVGCQMYISRVEDCTCYVVYCSCGPDRDDGAPYAKEECMEEKARKVAEAERLKDATALYEGDKKNEVENENQGFYTTFNNTCKVNTTVGSCKVGPSTFGVTQSIDTDGKSTTTIMDVAGQTLRSDSADLESTTKAYPTSLDLTQAAKRRRLDNDDTVGCEEKDLGDGQKMCLEEYNQMRSWLENEGREQATQHTQGTAMGTESTGTKIYSKEPSWAKPTLKFMTPLESKDTITLSLACDDDLFVQADGVRMDFLQQRGAMQRDVLDKYPGIKIDFAQELQESGRTTHTNKTDVHEKSKSCLQNFITLRYSIMDDSHQKKESNALFFDFTVTRQPPQLNMISDSNQTEFACNEAASIITPIAERPTVTGGCLDPEAFGQVRFTDTVLTDLDSNKCTSYAISRAWSLLPPVFVGSVDNFEFDSCAAELAGLTPSVKETFTGVACEPEPFVIPEVCKESPFRIAGYEDFSRGFPRLALLPNGRDSFHYEEFLVDVVMGETAEIVFANGDSMNERSVNILDGSMFIVPSQGGGRLMKVPSLIEETFYLDSTKGGNVAEKQGPSPTALPAELSVPSPNPSFFPRPVGPAKAVATGVGRPLMECEGDCDNDSDCGPGLYCFQRTAGMIPVPGCAGGETDSTETDYCTFRDLPSDNAGSSSKSGKRTHQAQHGPAIKHTAVLPQLLRQYTELCNEFLVFAVDVGGDTGHICFHADCSSGGSASPVDGLPMADAVQSLSMSDAVQNQQQVDERTEELQIAERWAYLKNGARKTTMIDGLATTG